MKDWITKLDCAFVVALALTATIALCSCEPSREEEAIETTREHTTLPTVVETTEAVIEPTETEPPVTEATEPPQTEPEETEPEETEPPVILYDAPLGEDLQLHIIQLAEANKIDPAVIVAMAYHESRYNPEAIGDNGNSFGLCQIQPRWHSDRMERLGVTNLLDPFQNVTVCIDYLAQMLDWYGYDIAKALTAYNAGSYRGEVTYYAKAILAKAEELRSDR